MILLKPVLLLANRLKKNHESRESLKTVMPKLLKIGHSVGFVIGARLLRSIDWRLKDYISYAYDEENDELRVTNFSARMRREKERAVHKKH